ncbi:aminoglycoside phosphotransferase family protein [Saccharibacillus sp. CPCC 101409]|uniref:phosphotransferase family protein n=1 Tax=Saccharibacillus sp. CPCC 101409 TaxID=3058041 RepID=UPI002672FFF7|nr:aminoglycoside phosphotransferase family protein [Saccharibacillus sp. CPCC 101409]MDO3412508.1 aminoglycoside phosphotransferase family protein [Saccharibacillus sp. CPCC 101409]
MSESNSTNQEHERIIRSLAAQTLGSDPSVFERMTFGHRNVVYRASSAGRSIIVRTNADLKVMRGTGDNMTDLRELGIPVPRILAFDFDGGDYPFAYMILEEIPGRDLRDELPDMTQEQMTAVAERIASFQRKASRLPRGMGYGWVPIGDKGPFHSWSELIRSDRETNFQQSGEVAGTDVLERLDRRLEALTSYFDTIEPVCFLDDLTIKNVIVEKGELRGVIDFDVVCYGDSLYAIALTQTAIVCDIGEHRLFYADELCRAMGLDAEQRRIVDVYAALFAGSFLDYCRENGDEEGERRLLRFMGKWLEN